MVLCPQKCQKRVEVCYLNESLGETSGKVYHKLEIMSRLTCNDINFFGFWGRGVYDDKVQVVRVTNDLHCAKLCFSTS